MRAAGADVEVRAEGPTALARWPAAGITLEIRMEAAPSRTEPGTSVGRAGTWLTSDDGRGVHIPDSGGVLTVTGGVAVDGRVRCLDATVDLDPERSSRLVNAYQSWDYAGVRPGAEGGHTWWGGAVAERRTGRGLAFHVATARRAATSFRTRPDRRSLRLTAHAGGTPRLRRHPGSFGFLPGESTELPRSARPVDGEPVLLAAGPDALLAMEEVADAVAAACDAPRRWDGPPIVGWESWYHYGFEISPRTLLENGRAMRERFPDEFRVLQLDDGWQRAYGAWEPRPERWPDDLGRLVAEIRQLGCLPGLWLAPFMVRPGGPGLGERAELLVGDPDDPDGEAPLADDLVGRHALDATHPAAAEWLHDLGVRVRRWGFEMVKLDFLHLGAQEGRRHDASVTGTAALATGLDALLEGLGDDVYVLACGMPFVPAAGRCHGNRVGGDVAAPVLWPRDRTPFDPDRGWLGVVAEARNVAARWWSHRRLFDNDPDVVLATGPDEGPPLSLEEARALAAVAALSGGPYLLADELESLPDAKLEVLRDPALLGAVWGPGFRPRDLFDRVDTAPDPDFYATPTALSDHWEAVRSGHAVAARFDWTSPFSAPNPATVPGFRAKNEGGRER